MNIELARALNFFVVVITQQLFIQNDAGIYRNRLKQWRWKLVFQTDLGATAACGKERQPY